MQIINVGTKGVSSSTSCALCLLMGYKYVIIVLSGNQLINNLL